MRRQTDAITIFEYARHEGNYALRNMLSGARADEKAGRVSPRRVNVAAEGP